jgi:hypothetical protein
MLALVSIIDEYAELAEAAPETMASTDTVARLGRAPAVTLIAATQRADSDHRDRQVGQEVVRRRYTCHVREDKILSGIPAHAPARYRSRRGARSGIDLIGGQPRRGDRVSARA